MVKLMLGSKCQTCLSVDFECSETVVHSKSSCDANDFLFQWQLIISTYYRGGTIYHIHMDTSIRTCRLCILTITQSYTRSYWVLCRSGNIQASVVSMCLCASQNVHNSLTTKWPLFQFRSAIGQYIGLFLYWGGIQCNTCTIQKEANVFV